MKELLDDISIGFQYLATLESLGVANIHESVDFLSEKHGNGELIKQIFYAILSIDLNESGQ
jgi:hypothetical protein